MDVFRCTQKGDSGTLQWSTLEIVHTVVETIGLINDTRSLGLSDVERFEIVTWIAANPSAGSVIEGTGGAQKVRFVGKDRGKSGGFRVISFYADISVPVFLWNLFAKSEKTNITSPEKQALKKILHGLVRAYKSKGATQ